jgi:uncharacterized membrane protein
MPEDQQKRDDIWSFGMVSVTRIETITDGVLAIAMTILVLELSLETHILESIAEGHYSEISGEIMGYLMGFLVLGIYWVFHHFMFHFIKRSDGILSWLNILFLMFAALVPLATKVNNTQGGTYSLLFYYVTTVISIMMLYIIWKYATWNYRLVDRDLDKRNISFVSNTILIGTGIFTISLVGQYFVEILGYLGFVSLIYVISATTTGNYIPFMKRRS